MLERVIMIVYRLLGRDALAYRSRLYQQRGMTLGHNVRLFSRIDTTEPYLLEFGDNVTVSGEVAFITHDNSITKMHAEKNNVFGRIKIGSDCFIGFRAILLPGIELAPGIVVGAGSVVTRSFAEPGIIVAGNPARKISTVVEYLRKYEDIAISTARLDAGQLRDLLINKPEMLLSKGDRHTG